MKHMVVSQKEYHKRYHRKYPIRYMLRSAKNRAKKFDLVFDLVEGDLTLPEFCPILGIKLEVSTDGRGNPQAASLDRIDNKKGYTKDNVQIISLLANQMKSTATKEELIKFANWIKQTYE